MHDEPLTSQEQQVLHLLWDGLSTREIAEQLGRRYNTIAWYRQRIRAKFGVHTTAAVLAMALEGGILTQMK